MCPVISGDDSNQFEKWEPGEVFTTTFPKDNNGKENSIEETPSSYSAEELTKIIEKAKQESFEQGRLAGIQQAQDEFQQQMESEVQSKIESLSKLVKSLNEPLIEIDENIEKEILNLVIQVSSILYRREVRMNPEQLLMVVKEAKSLIPSSQANVQIHLNPEDVSMLQESELELKDESLCQLFVEDYNLQRGDCRVISDQTQVDATLEARLHSIIEQVMTSEK